jgi:Reverse transcriptase (RNA-dependent DNA polymerase)
MQAKSRERVLDAETEKQFWDEIAKIAKSAPEIGAFLAEELAANFEERMNRQDEIHVTVSGDRIALMAATSQLLEEETQDRTAGRWFLRDFLIEELEQAKAKLRARKRTSTGLDGISYESVLKMRNEELLILVNECLQERDAPSTWLSTELIGICKRGKDKEKTDSYRAVGLESCMLKFMTLLINQQLVGWADEEELIPDSQNGSRQGRRTNNNAFVLRCAAERAKADGMPLYVTFADISNAFPSCDHPTLWLKLVERGAGGRIFDWLRMLYREMMY